MNIKEIKELIELLKETDIAELELEKEGTRIRLKKPCADYQMPRYIPVQDMQVPSHASVQKDAQQQIQSGSEAKAPEVKDNGYSKIAAPMVGTFYRAPAPDAAPFVNEGDVVSEGQTLCILEAMKLMNEIKAEYKCKIMKILVENAQAVEYGMPLFEVEPIK